MEQYHDYKMTDGKSVVEQAHEIHCMTKKLEHLKISLAYRFVTSGIITKLPSSWRELPLSQAQEVIDINLKSNCHS